MQPVISSIVLTVNPGAIDSLSELDPFNQPNPEEMVWCIFFPTEEDRAELLASLKAAATQAVPVLPDRDAAEERLRAEFAQKAEREDEEGALTALIGWWSGLYRRTYHAYSLRVGYGRYRTSCMISLAPLEADEARAYVDIALGRMENRRDRVLEAFGF